MKELIQARISCLDSQIASLSNIASQADAKSIEWLMGRYAIIKAEAVKSELIHLLHETGPYAPKS